MRKLLLPTLVLLGQKAYAQDYDYDAETPEEPSYGHAGHVEEHFDEEYDFHFKKVTEYTKSEMKTYWEHRENGEYCSDLFAEIYDMYSSLGKTVRDIKLKIKEYNEYCSDKCIPGYVKCAGSAYDTCVPECECCE